MSTVATIAVPKRQKQSPLQKAAAPHKAHEQAGIMQENPANWPRDSLEAYRRGHGPYSIDNADAMLENESVELYNGWLVWQEMTNIRERRIVANIQDMLSISARKANFGQALPDQVECLLSDGTAIKPDASLISWQRIENDVLPKGPRERPSLIGGPELVVEVRSPSNSRTQERHKRSLYFANKVQIVWDVDEEKQTIWVYRAETPAQPTRFVSGDVIDCEPLLPGWHRNVSDIFAKQVSAETVIGEVAEAIFNDGRTEGAAQALRQVLPMLVRIRFGEAPANLVEQLAGCNLAQLQLLQSEIEECRDLASWLELLAE